MSAPKRKRIQREKHREMMTDFVLKGWTQQKIAEYLEISQAQVSYDLKQIRKEWRERSYENVGEHKAIAMAKLDLIEKEAWEAWDKSKEDEEIETAEKIIAEIERSAREDGENTKSANNRNKATKRVRKRDGNAVFLAKILDVCKERHSILGLNQTKPTESHKPEDILRAYTEALANSVINQHQSVSKDSDEDKLIGVGGDDE